MHTFFHKSIAVLIGITFLFGGASMAMAAFKLPVAPAGGAIAQANSILSTLACNGLECLADLPILLPLLSSYVLYITSSAILSLSGYIFDAVLTLSIDRTFVLQPFIDDVWTIIRDFSNMAFIFILLYTGISTMFGMGNWRKTVIQVVIIALLINFSLFFTKVVIDAGNVLAVGVYSAIGVEKVDKIHTKTAAGGIKERDLSSSLVAAFGPQTFLSASGVVKSPYLAVAIFIIGFIVNMLVAWAFFRVALVFIGRVIGFWVLMITSPFAFISTTFPKGNIFQKWLDNLISLSFVAPVFLFLLYVIMKVLTEGNVFATLVNPSANNIGEFSFDALFIPVVMVIFIYLALNKSVSLAEKMAGDFGKLGAKIGGAVMGIATGGTAMLGRKAIGGIAANALKGGGLKEGGLAQKAARAAVRSSFDVRNIGGKDSIFGATIGGKISQGVGTLGIGKGGGVGGVEKVAKVQAEKDLDITKDKEMTIFEEAAQRDLAETQKKTNEDNLAASEQIFAASTTELAEALKVSAAAQKAHDESETARLEKAAERAHEEATERYERDKGTEHEAASLKALIDAQNVRDIAKNNHDNSATGVDLEAAKATEATKKATLAVTTKAVEESRKEASKTAEALAKEAIKEENTRRRNSYADKVEKKGRRMTADKIRAGGESNHSKKAKELAKELEDLKKEGSGAISEEVAYVEKKIEEHKKSQ